MRDSLAAGAPELAERVQAMSRLDVTAAARQALSCAPQSARIAVTIFEVIKPQPNSFVFGPNSAPQLFLFVNAAETPAHFFNRLTHELHHVALNTACPEDPAPDLLADDATRHLSRRDGRGDGSRCAQFAQIEEMVRGVVDGRIATRDSVRALAQTFYGSQGPRYVVGWKMAATIETELGRPALIAAMCDPRRLMATYNRAAVRANAGLPIWDKRLLATLSGG